MKGALFIIFSFLASLSANAHAPIDTTGIVINLTEIDPEIGNPHRTPPCVPTCMLYGHILCIYADAEKRVSVFPVDYCDQTNPLFTTYVPENTYSCVLPSWLEGTYAIEIEINGIVFIGEIEI